MSRSEEHASELQSQFHLVCRLLLEGYVHHLDLHSFPTRRSSDLALRSTNGEACVPSRKNSVGHANSRNVNGFKSDFECGRFGLQPVVIVFSIHEQWISDKRIHVEIGRARV